MYQETPLLVANMHMDHAQLAHKPSELASSMMGEVIRVPQSREPALENPAVSMRDDKADPCCSKGLQHLAKVLLAGEPADDLAEAASPYSVGAGL